jgi:chromosome partitioning protein
LGAALVNHGERVLLIDLDSQANCSKGLGIILRANDRSIRDVLLDPLGGVSDIIRQTAIEGLDIAPAHTYLSTADVELTAEVGGARRLAIALQEVDDVYDHILVDTPPYLGVLTLNGLVAAESVIIPMEAEPYALDGMDIFERTLEKTRRFLAHPIEVLGVLVTKFRRGTTLHAELLEELRKYWKNKVFDTVIRINIDVAAAAVDQLPVTAVKPTCAAAEDYTALAEEVLNREQEQASERDAQ